MIHERSLLYSRIAHVALVGVVVALGVGVRLNNLSTESVYWDEFSSLIHLHPPAGYEESPDFQYWDNAVIRKQVHSLQEFWQANRELDPATMPLYYTFEYFAWEWGGYSVPNLRLLSVAFSLLTFPFIYLLGRALWGPSAGVIALFMFALSPVHTQFAQEIRMYSLFGALAAASAFTFYQVVEKGRWWWGPHLLVHLFLSWIHPFAIWLPFTQGVFLVLFHWQRWRFILAWGTAQAVVLIPAALYISQIKFFGQETTDTWMVLPGWPALVGDIFADDYVGLTSQLWGRADAFKRFFSEETANHLADSRMVYGMWCAAFVIGLGLLCVGWQAAQWMQARVCGEAYSRWKWAAFLVMWALLPPLILIFLSNVWRPMVMPRYTMHCSFAFYLLAAGGIAALRWNVLRAIPVALLVLLYAYQQGLVFDGPHRTNWNGVADFLKTNADDDDLILAENWLWKRVFTYSMGPVPQVIGYATHADTMAEQARVWLDSAYPKDPANPEPRGLWLVINNNYFNMAPAFELETALAARGMMWRRTFFTGIEGVWVYEVADDMMTPHASRVGWQPHEAYATDFQDLSMAFWVHKDHANGACIAEEGLRVLPNHPRLWSYLGMNLKEMGEFRAAQAAFRKAVQIAEQDYPWTLTNLGECYLELGQPGPARGILEKSLQNLPDDTRPRWLLARAYIETGKPWEAVRILNEKLGSQHWEPKHWEMLQLAQQSWGQMISRAR